MKKSLKAFTLVELIIVMLIMGILMTALINMMKPIRSTYLDATLYETQRTTQSGIVRYITENLRYAKSVGVYTTGASTSVINAGGTTSSLNFNGNAEDAVIEFKKKTGITDDRKIKVITIDNRNPYTFANRTFYGRLLVSRPVTTTTSDTTSTKIQNADVLGTGAGYARLALGSAYYGNSSYSINFVPEYTLADGLEIDETTPGAGGGGGGANSTDGKNDQFYKLVLQGEGYSGGAGGGGGSPSPSPTPTPTPSSDKHIQCTGAFNVTVSSIIAPSVDQNGQTVENIGSTTEVVSTEGMANCPNTQLGKNVADTRFVKTTGSGTSLAPAGTVTNGEMTYIVFSLPDYD